MNNLNKSELFEEKNEIKNINDFIKRQNEITKLFESGVYVGENNKANNSSNHEALYQKIITMKTILESHYNKEIDPIDYLYKKYFKISDNGLKKLKEISIGTVSISNYLNETFKDRSINFQSTNYDLNKLIS